jgi:sulfur-carrier protein adenylyltransferase/sulfurtransferase
MNIRIKLAAIFIPLGILIAAIPDNKVVAVKADAKQLLAEIRDGSNVITTDAVADMIVKKDPSFVLFDVRSKADYDKFHLPGAVNVPIDNILSDEYAGYFDQDIKMNVLYANGTTNASQAWMLLRQKGYKNIYVLKGGLNYWAETIMNPQKPASTSPDDELARYDFRKAAGGVLGGGALAPAEGQSAAAAPALPAMPSSPKKKRVAGGCS